MGQQNKNEENTYLNVSQRSHASNAMGMGL